MNAGLPVDTTLLAAGFLLVVGVLVVSLSERIRIPAALLSLGVGMLFGSDALGLVDLDDMAMVRNLSVVALVIILFEGGLTTKPSALKESGAPGLTLATVGVLVTMFVTAAGVKLVFDVDWDLALLFGAVVASTDAAVVFDLLRKAPLPRRIAGILEVESGANDPVAIVLTLGLLSVLEGEDLGPLDWALSTGWQLLGGLAIGLVIGWLGRLVLGLRLRSEALYPIVALGIAGLSYGLAAVVGASGFLAVYVSGLVVGSTVPRHRRSIRGFHASLANGADIALFLLLGLLVFPSELPGVAGQAMAVTAVLVLVARPLAVALSLLPFRIPWREGLVLSWAGLRGAVPIVLATFPATAGLAEGQTIFNVVFFVVLISTLIQGTTTPALVRRLGLETDHPAWQSIAEALPIGEQGIDLAEIVVTPALAIDGRTLSEYPPAPGALVVAVIREGEAILPTGSTRVLAGDVLVLSLDVDQVALTDITAWARGEGGPKRSPSPDGDG